MAADIAETITEITPGIGMKLIYFTGTKASATDYVTFSDYTQVLYAAATTSTTVGSDGADDPVTAITTNVVTFSAGTGTIHGIAVVV